MQIHHIDYDPSNNIESNLAVLCLECHYQTQTSGGFGRGLNQDLVVKYRNAWIARVLDIRREADQLAVSRVAGTTLPSGKNTTASERGIPDPKLLSFLEALPEYRRDLHKKYKPEWNSGVTARMVQASYSYVNSLKGLLVYLSGLCPGDPLNGVAPEKYFTELISSRYAWHRYHTFLLEPHVGGTIVNVEIGGAVVSDVETMIEDMVYSISKEFDGFNVGGWIDKWSRAT